MRSIGMGIALVLVVSAAWLVPARPPHAQAQVMATNLTCGLRSCTGTTPETCATVAQNVGISIDVDGARAHGAAPSDWVPATIQPDLVTFTSTRTDAGGTELQTFEVSRTSLRMIWRWSLTLSNVAADPVGAVGRYQCQLVHAQF